MVVQWSSGQLWPSQESTLAHVAQKCGVRIVKNPLACPMPKHRSKASLISREFAMPLCMGVVGVRGFLDLCEKGLLF
jgi:hypothetical protein